jgi:hypothetical protein
LEPVDFNLQIENHCDVMDNDHGKRKEMVLELDFGVKKSPWVMTNEQYYTQKDGYNCGQIACLKIMEIYGWITPGSIHQIAPHQGDIVP